MLSTPRMPHARSARCRVSSPSSVSLRAWLSLSPVASCSSLLSWSPVLAGSTTVPGGASKPYLRRASMSCSGLASSVLAVCLGGVLALSVSAAVPCCGHVAAAVLGPPILALAPPPAPLALVAQVVVELPSPNPPPPPTPGPPSPAVAIPGVSSPWGNASTPGVLMPCGDSTPPPTPWQSPWGFLPLHRPRGC